MRRTAILVTSLAVAASCFVWPASADSVQVVRGPDAFPSDDQGNPLAGIGGIGCSDPFGANWSGPFLSLRRDPTAPLGERVWQMDLIDGLNTAVGAYLVAPTADAGTVATADFDPTDTTSGAAYAAFVPTDLMDGTYWVGFTTLPAISGGWQTVTSSGVVYHWRRYDMNRDVVEDGGLATYAGFAAAHGGSGYAEFVLGYGCEGNAFRTDRWTIGTPGDVTSYDLEGLLTQIAITRSTSTVTAGKGVTLTGDLGDSTGGKFSSAPLDLQAKPYGAPDFSTVDTVDTGPNGEPASTVVRPLHNTAYRWAYPSSDCCDGSFSDPVTIKVRTAVTSALADLTVHKGDMLTLTGKTTPKKPGSAVTLWRKTPIGNKKLVTGQVKRDGSYWLSTRASSKGYWKLFAVVAAGSGNLAGTSPVRTAKVS